MAFLSSRLLVEFMNQSEQFVFKLCRRSFLSLWSYASPRGKGGKELCDILVVCDPHVIIFSVKEVNYKETDDTVVGWERWRRSAIEESSGQIYGAERWLGTATSVLTKEGEVALDIPDSSVRRVHRVAVALGASGKVPVSVGDMGKGYVHVLDELALDAVMNELDTITDFVKYLQDKEALQERELKIITSGEENLFALYLHNGRCFPQSVNLLFVDDDLWTTLKLKPEYCAKKEADKESYLWDKLIEEFSNNMDKENVLFKDSAEEFECVVRVMAKEDRLCRRILSKCFKEFHQSSDTRSRMVPSPSGVLYVFLALPHGTNRQYRIAELAGRSYVARMLYPEVTQVIGIATEQYEANKGSSLDAYYLLKENWTPEDQTQAENLQREFGYFATLRQSHMSEDEYPNAN
jgi:hypothetical protein